ncbi:hypothetical protein PILCRDRAFT_17520 [Piloderma croceum F 1598]|uniref:Uncharacterized protein n=1 Tax=Piloderma croceum (strain F 1598) TaxID=765440 RepID=A0A0C3AB30_PILCF|nr:hypothetical protein PILCRDRAFT_17520 [Piloderma croceum F 1598]
MTMRDIDYGLWLAFDPRSSGSQSHPEEIISVFTKFQAARDIHEILVAKYPDLSQQVPRWPRGHDCAPHHRIDINPAPPSQRRWWKSNS